MNKKIIFIAGTSRSGSTLLDLILGNQEKHLSLGEIYAVFNPTKKKHFVLRNELMQDKNWSKVLKDKQNRLFFHLQNMYPDKNVFIDSSKDPFWIKKHILSTQDYFDVHAVLIYKTPEELAKSFIKRGYYDQWQSTYIHYHKKFNTIITDYMTISLNDLLKKDQYLTQLCNKLGIIFTPEMRNYQNRNSTLFFGSETPKRFNNIKVTDVKAGIDNIVIDNQLKEMHCFLKSKGISLLKQEDNNTENYKYPHLFLFLLKLKTKIKLLKYRALYSLLGSK